MNMRFNAAHQWKSIRGNHGDSKRASTGQDHLKPFALVVDEDTSFVRLVLNRKRYADDATLSVTGRDVIEAEYALMADHAALLPELSPPGVGTGRWRGLHASTPGRPESSPSRQMAAPTRASITIPGPNSPPDRRRDFPYRPTEIL
jgi:hypothetical protein